LLDEDEELESKIFSSDSYAFSEGEESEEQSWQSERKRDVDSFDFVEDEIDGSEDD